MVDLGNNKGAKYVLRAPYAHGFFFLSALSGICMGGGRDGGRGVSSSA